jgi:hypothetical protein
VADDLTGRDRAFRELLDGIRGAAGLQM